MNVKIPKMKETDTTSRDLRKLRSNPKFFLNELSKIKWETFVNMRDVDQMEQFWSMEINKCFKIRLKLSVLTSTFEKIVKTAVN